MSAELLLLLGPDKEMKNKSCTTKATMHIEQEDP